MHFLYYWLVSSLYRSHSCFHTSFVPYFGFDVWSPNGSWGAVDIHWMLIFIRGSLNQQPFLLSSVCTWNALKHVQTLLNDNCLIRHSAAYVLLAGDKSSVLAVMCFYSEDCLCVIRPRQSTSHTFSVILFMNVFTPIPHPLHLYHSYFHYRPALPLAFTQPHSSARQVSSLPKK